MTQTRIKHCTHTLHYYCLLPVSQCGLHLVEQLHIRNGCYE